MSVLEQSPIPLEYEEEVAAHVASRSYDLATVGTETTEGPADEELRRNYNIVAGYTDRVNREIEEPALALKLNVAKAFEKATLSDAKEHYASNKHALQALAIKEDGQRANTKY